MDIVKRLCITLFVFLPFVSFSAHSATVSYYIDQSNDLPNGVNYAQVTISDSGADINFSVEVFEGAFPAPLSNFGMQTFSFNYDTNLDVENISFSNINPANWTISEDANAGGGFGRFEFEWSGTGNTRTSLFSFTISNVDGDTVESYAMGAPGLGNGATEFFAAHIAGYSDSSTGNTSGQFAGSTAVPLPAAAWLFATGLSGLVITKRRSSKKYN